MKRTVMVCGLALIMTIGIASMAMAQPGGGGRGQGGPGGPGGQGRGGPQGGMMMQRGPGGGGMMGSMMMLGNPQIAEEVGVTPEQATALREAGREMFSGMRDMTPEERQAAFQKVGEQMQAKAKEILGQAKLDRLQQIQLQMGGITGAVQNPAVVTKLALSDTQKAAIQKIQDDARTAREASMGDIREKMQNMSQEERGKFFEEMRANGEKARAEMTQKVEAVLSTTQKKQLTEMMGPKFEMQPRDPNQQRTQRGQDGQGQGRQIRDRQAPVEGAPARQSGFGAGRGAGQGRGAAAPQ